MDQLKAKIRDIPDFPKKGIMFKDITPLVQDPTSLRLAIAGLIAPFKNTEITAVAGMEARGFIFGSLVAWELNVGFIPLRKPGKLPYDVQSVDYQLEYWRSHFTYRRFTGNRRHSKSQLPISRKIRRRSDCLRFCCRISNAGWT